MENKAIAMTNEREAQLLESMNDLENRMHDMIAQIDNVNRFDEMSMGMNDLKAAIMETIASIRDARIERYEKMIDWDMMVVNIKYNSGEIGGEING